MIKVDQLTKLYGKNTAVKSLSFQLSLGNCIALLGPNGAGKTTTLRMMSGLIRPTSGSINLGTSNHKDIRREIGYLPQHPHFHLWMTGKEFLIYVGQLAYLSKKEARKKAELLIERVGLKDAAKRKIATYSGGMKQRLGIAQAMIHRPKLLMLDEPVSALDPIGRRDVLNLMEELKRETTLLFSTHILSDAEEASDEILLMHKGSIVESGPLDQLRKRHHVDKISIQSELPPEVLKSKVDQLDFINRVERDKQRLDLYVSDIKSAREQLLKQSLEEGWDLEHFEVGRITLEDLFMKVVNGHAVDDRF
ncbi:ABC transporter ATP-binding protein [Halobacillus naozhouensis]|uniref:ABC transporter ATP-binding protein n=1 Tax=Halobacillus naozhouensis TaxID=554880 RepID=A0ABY8J030_9BACI|nr:ABC transporter ATP-binding protein [Halobacillus naozhouensis]WFT75854.1 ABC transporter ATP-binding protein [Halobacillus naozhouensis]